MVEGDNQSVSQMLGKKVELTLGDGKKYKLGQFSILDLAYFEEKFGSTEILFDNKKQFTVILNILYCILKKNHPEIKYEDLGDLLPFSFLQEHPEIVELITKQVSGSIQPKAQDPNFQKSEINQVEKK